MLLAILGIGLVMCALGWFNAWLARMALCMHMVVKNYTPPTDQEMEAYIKEILRRTFNMGGE